jgi:hypothetical protein
MDSKPVLGKMKIVDMGGSLVALFDNLSKGKSCISYCNKTGARNENADERDFVGHTAAALHGIGRNKLITTQMHQDDCAKIADARRLIPRHG